MIDHEMEQTVSEIEAPVQAEELWEAAGGPFTSMGGLNNVLKRIYESFCSFFSPDSFLKPSKWLQ